MAQPIPGKEYKVIDKYLAHYAEAEIVDIISSFPTGFSFDRALVIPAFDEEHHFVDRLKVPFTNSGKLLAIVVINQCQGLPAAKRNEELWQWIMEKGDLRWQTAQLRLLEWTKNQTFILIVDRFNNARQIPKAQGVGLARKIGCDIAVALHRQKVLSTNWIHSSDADATLPQDYFSATADLSSYSAATYPFHHLATTAELEVAIRLYESALNYYVEALRWAGSPYAFHTIGSCIALNVYNYCMVRGFPKRSGGEDFYLLNKLAKTAPIKSLSQGKIQIEARLSERVPFGTGPALTKIIKLPKPQEDFTTYDPRIFKHLQEVIAHMPTIWKNISAFKTMNFQEFLAELSSESITTLEKLGFSQCLEHQFSQIKNASQSWRHFHSWLDGFRTLKFVHSMQQNYYPPVSLQKALQEFQLQRN